MALSALLPANTLLVAAQLVNGDDQYSRQAKAHLSFFQKFTEKGNFEIDTSANLDLNIHDNSWLKLRDIGKRTISATFKKGCEKIGYDYPLRINVISSSQKSDVFTQKYRFKKAGKSAKSTRETLSPLMKKSEKESYIIDLPNSNGDNQLLIKEKKYDMFYIKMDKFEISLVSLLRTIKPRKAVNLDEVRFPYYSIRIGDCLYEPSLLAICRWGFSENRWTRLTERTVRNKFLAKNKIGQLVYLYKEKLEDIESFYRRKIRKITTTMALVADEFQLHGSQLEVVVTSSKLYSEEINIAIGCSYLYHQGSLHPNKKILTMW